MSHFAQTTTPNPLRKMEKKVYLTEHEIKQLKLKAEGLGIEDRGWLSILLRFLAKEDFVILDTNLKKFLSTIKLKL